MKVGKPKSKRTPVRLRHKIEKASAAKQRKQRKEAKSNPQWRSRLKKDPGIPNLFPYKAKLLAEIEEGKRRKAEEQMHRRELAKARRQGDAIQQTVTMSSTNGSEVDEEDDSVTVLRPQEQEMDIDDQNPMAALMASAQARAHTYGDDGEDEAGGGSEDDDGGNWNGIDEATVEGHLLQVSKKTLPKRAMEDPVKTVTLLTSHAQKTAPTGIQMITDYYKLPPLVASANDFPTRFLVEVARKRGRLGRGGVPNLHAAALLVLNDINDERLQLPSEMSQRSASKPRAGSVSIVKALAAPFRIEGLWNDQTGAVETASAMAIDT